MIPKVPHSVLLTQPCSRHRGNAQSSKVKRWPELVKNKKQREQRLLVGHSKHRYLGKETVSHLCEGAAASSLPPYVALDLEYN